MSERLEAIDASRAAATSGAADDKLTRHVRRYMPFYALAAVFAIFVFVLPTRQGNDDARTMAGDITSPATDVTGASPSATAGVDSAGTTTGRTTTTTGRRVNGSTAGGTSVAPDGTVAPGVSGALNPLAWTATGKTRGGFDCKKGVRQLPWSAYAVPCFPAWSGNNGGATTRGVTAKQITIVRRVFPESANSQAVDAFVSSAGFASDEEVDATRERFVAYFNKVFELWGRQVKLITYESQFGNDTDEAQGKGKEGACADVDTIIERYKPFAIAGGSGPFSECAAERKLVVFGAGAYYPESWYRKYHPYLWNTVTECERIVIQTAEYVGKRLANRPAKWAKSLQKDKPRTFAVYVPNNDEYQHCTKVFETTLLKKYNAKVTSRFNYTLDVARFPDEAAKGIIQFNAAGATSIVMSCDPLSPVFLTQSARAQNYFPEWVLIGVAATDVDQFARLWDQREISGSLFGMSQLGSNAKILGPKGEGTSTYKRITGTNIPPGAQTEYYGQMGIFGVLQAAGPRLTPETLANAFFNLPPGGAPSFEVGYTSYHDAPDGTPGGHDHTAIDDSREIYWRCDNVTPDAQGTSLCNSPKGFDGKGGTYVETYGGKRFRNGQWPREEPPIYR